MLIGLTCASRDQINTVSAILRLCNPLQHAGQIRSCIIVDGETSFAGHSADELRKNELVKNLYLGI
jgi:ABC-type lipopolysaccharide export system ATPase subunit